MWIIFCKCLFQNGELTKWGYSDSNRGPPVCDTDALTN